MHTHNVMGHVNNAYSHQIESHVQQAVEKLYASGNHTEVHDTVIVLAPLSDEVYISGDLRNTKQRSNHKATPMSSLFFITHPHASEGIAWKVIVCARTVCSSGQAA